MHQAHAIHPRRRWLQLDWHDPYWHGWAASSVLLAAGLAGLTQAYFVVMALTVVQMVALLAGGHAPRSFPLQVRAAYLGILALGQLPGCAGLYWLPALGTPALVLFGYCPLARVMALAPWNRTRPFSLALLRRALFTPPRPGAAIDWLAEPTPATGAGH